MFNSPRNQRIAAVLALTSLLPFAITGVPFLPLVATAHKVYLRQWRWALAYGAIAMMPIPWIAKMAWTASVIEGIWYLMQEPEAFDLNFNCTDDGAMLVVQADGTIGSSVSSSGGSSIASPAAKVFDVTSAVRDLDQLRQDGLISEYEFEQKRRRLIDRIG
jgi:TM2 domain-containing membrane protein YozV